MSYKLKTGLLLFFILPALHVFAQPTLPQIGAISNDGINILSWTNPYTTGVTSVSIQRSADSTFNYATIGFVKNLDEARQVFVDSRPLLGNNWYRVVVLFNSGTDWISDVIKLSLDSNAIANRKPLPPNDSLQAMLKSLQTLSPEQAVSNLSQRATYPKSQYVFTNPFTGNIDIQIEDAFDHNYTLYFYDENDKEVLFIPRINDTAIILDKMNFESSGLFHFKLMKENKEFATGYITIY